MYQIFSLPGSSCFNIIIANQPMQWLYDCRARVGENAHLSTHSRLVVDNCSSPHSALAIGSPHVQHGRILHHLQNLSFEIGSIAHGAWLTSCNCTCAKLSCSVQPFLFATSRWQHATFIVNSRCTRYFALPEPGGGQLARQADRVQQRGTGGSDQVPAPTQWRPHG